MIYPRVKAVITKQTKRDLAPLFNAIADEHGIPPLLLVAGAIVESDIYELSSRERAYPDVSGDMFPRLSIDDVPNCSNAYTIGTG